LNDSLIYMTTEFLHSQDDGGGGAAMSDFWELHWKSKKSGGGFIWAMVDEAVVRTDFNNVLDANGLNGNDGILGPHREKEGSFFALKEVFSPVKISMKELPVNFDGKINIENRFHFTNISQCSFQWALVNYYLPQDKFSGYTVQQKGKRLSHLYRHLQTEIFNCHFPLIIKNMMHWYWLHSIRLKKRSINGSGK
jgi:hypothetical protein